MTEENTTDVTETLPTMEPKTRSVIKKFAAVATIGAVAALAIDDQIKRFKKRKTVTVTVEDNPSAN